MAIPFNDNLKWEGYKNNPNWHANLPKPATAPIEDLTKRAANAAFGQPFKQTYDRGIQFVKDTARLVLKDTIRSVWTPVILPKNWKQRERVKVNAKLAGYAFVQLAFVPVKFFVALTALAMSGRFFERAQAMLDKCDSWTAHLDGRASQLEALKGVAKDKNITRDEYELYKLWLYTIPAELCRKPI